MDWPHIIYPTLLILFLWLGPYVAVIFRQDFSKTPPEATASDRRLIRFCLSGLIAVTAALLVHWWLG